MKVLRERDCATEVVESTQDEVRWGGSRWCMSVKSSQSFSFRLILMSPALLCRNVLFVVDGIDMGVSR